MVQRVLVVVGWFVISETVFFFFSLSSPKNYSLTLFVVGISTLVLIFLFSKFCS